MVLFLNALIFSTMRHLGAMDASLTNLIFYILIFFLDFSITKVLKNLSKVNYLLFIKEVACFLFYLLSLLYHLSEKRKEEIQLSFKKLTSQNSTNQTRNRVNITYQKPKEVKNKRFLQDLY